MNRKTVFRNLAILALILVPTIFGLFAGAGLGIGDMVMEAIASMSSTAALLLFAIIYFGIMIDVGLFDRLVEFILRIAGNDPVKVVLGTALLTRGIERAWRAAELDDVPPVSRVWVHTCSLDGPAALHTYTARGLELIDETVTDEDYPDEPLGSWASTGGPSAG